MTKLRRDLEKTLRPLVDEFAKQIERALRKTATQHKTIYVSEILRQK